MCGIVGYIGDKQAVGIIVDGLKRWSTGLTAARPSPCSRARAPRRRAPRLRLR